MKIDAEVEKAVKEVGMRDQYHGNVYLPDFARDIVLYGKSDAVGVLAAYGIGSKEFLEIAKLPLFKTHVDNLKKILASSDFAVVQIKAAEALEAAVLSLQGRIATGVMTTDELIKATSLLNKMVGNEAARKQLTSDIVGPVNTGTVVNIAYGGGDLSKLKPLPDNVPVNETFAKIAHRYNMDGVIDAEVDNV